MKTHDLFTWGQGHPLIAGMIAIATLGMVALAVIALTVRVTRAGRSTTRGPVLTATRGYYFGALVLIGISLDTSYRFFGTYLHITGREQWLVCAGAEIALFACAVGMRENVRRTNPHTGLPGTPGPERLIAWLLCGVMSYAAMVQGGPIGGPVRAALGPIGALILVHLALGVEVRRSGHARTGKLAKVGSEISERILSRLGLADDARDAAARTRDRAARRVARLSLSRRAMFRTARLSRALRASDVAHDPAARDRMLAELAALRHAAGLADLVQPSPWAPAPVAEVDQAPVPAHTAHIDTPPAISDDTYADGVLDGTVLLAATPPTWEGVTKNAAVVRADALLPGRSARQIAVALAEVGITVTESTVRGIRSRAHRASERQEHSDRDTDRAELQL